VSLLERLLRPLIEPIIVDILTDLADQIDQGMSDMDAHLQDAGLWPATFKQAKADALSGR
jgi:hypothetical protein